MDEVPGHVRVPPMPARGGMIDARASRACPVHAAAPHGAAALGALPILDSKAGNQTFAIRHRGDKSYRRRDKRT